MITNNTIQFKYIFPNENTWKNWVNQINSYDYQKTDAFFYTLLFEQYANTEILYDTIEAFKRHFASTYRNVRNRYINRQKIVQLINSITPDELTEQETMINIASFNNSSILDDPLNKINPYVDAQNATKTKTSKLSRYVEYLNALPDNFVFEFILEFQHHFKTVHTPTEYLYRR